MADKKIARSEVLEKIRNDIEALPEPNSHAFTRKSRSIFHVITKNREMLSSIIPDFKELWFMMDLAVQGKAPFSGPLKELKKILDDIIPKEKEKESNEFFMESLSKIISDFSSEISDFSCKVVSFSEKSEQFFKELDYAKIKEATELSPKSRDIKLEIIDLSSKFSNLSDELQELLEKIW